MDINFVCAMGPPGGGRNPITPRLTRHFNYLPFSEMDEVSKKCIFSTILGSWMGEHWAGVGEAMAEAEAQAGHQGQLGSCWKGWRAEPLTWLRPLFSYVTFANS